MWSMLGKKKWKSVRFRLFFAEFFCLYFGLFFWFGAWISCNWGLEMVGIGQKQLGIVKNGYKRLKMSKKIEKNFQPEKSLYHSISEFNLRASWKSVSVTVLCFSQIFLFVFQVAFLVQVLDRLQVASTKVCQSQLQSIKVYYSQLKSPKVNKRYTVT